MRMASNELRKVTKPEFCKKIFAQSIQLFVSKYLDLFCFRRTESQWNKIFCISLLKSVRQSITYSVLRFHCFIYFVLYNASPTSRLLV